MGDNDKPIPEGEWGFQEITTHWTSTSLGWSYRDGRGWDYDKLKIHFLFWTFLFLREKG